jgi:hypothetical protein
MYSHQHIAQWLFSQPDIRETSDDSDVTMTIDDSDSDVPVMTVV